MEKADPCQDPREGGIICLFVSQGRLGVSAVGPVSSWLGLHACVPKPEDAAALCIAGVYGVSAYP